MNLKELRERFFSTLKGFNREVDTPRVDEYINLAYIEVFRSHFWEFRKRIGNLTLIPDYTTGTCSITKYDGTNESASRTVIFSGASLTSDMVGRFFKTNDAVSWHRIEFISGNTAIIDSPITDSESGTGKSFRIWKRFYALKSDVDFVLDFDQYTAQKLNFLADERPENKYSDISEQGTTTEFTPFGTDQFTDIEYKTGTIQGTVDTNVLTGTGTNWLSSGLDTGDIVIVGDTRDEFRIKRIEGDTRISLFNFLKEPIAQGTEYRALRDNPLVFQFFRNPKTYLTLTYNYMGKAYSLIHPEKDMILLSKEFIPAIMSRAIYYGMRDADDQRKVQQLQIYTAELEGLKSKVRVIEPPFMMFKPAGLKFMTGRRN